MPYVWGLLEPAQRKNGKGFKVAGAHLFANRCTPICKRATSPG